MSIEGSFLPVQAGSASTSSIRQQMLQGLESGKEYRHGFVEEAVRTRIAAQIKTMRERRKWDYKQFAQEIDKKVSWVYRLEDPNATRPTITTLLQVAEAFDIGIDVRFCSFSELLDDVTTLGPESFAVPSFIDELRTGSFFKSRHRRKIRTNKRRRKSTSDTKTRQPNYDSGIVHIGASRPNTFAIAS
jgi:transcriptional regulator with XRE-family HTH domain